MKKQVVVIHGAGAFYALDRKDFMTALANHPVDLQWFRKGGGSWKSHLDESLGEGYEVLAPKMPDADNPHYEAWSIWFTRILPQLHDEVILVGHSLGGAFLLKFLAEETVPVQVTGLHIVAAPYIATDDEHGFSFPHTVTALADIPAIFLYYSRDDTIVEYTHGEAIQKHLPHAIFHDLEGRGHFNGDTLPEIVADIQSL